MFKQKNLFFLVAAILAVLVFAAGCGNSSTGADKSAKEKAKETGQAAEEKAAEPELIPEGKAFQALLKFKEINYEPEKINEIAEQGYIDINDYRLGYTDTVTINNKQFYKFEQVSLGGKGAATAYYVSADTGAVYNEFLDGILNEFNIKELNYENVFDRRVFTLTEKSTHDTVTWYIDGKTNKLYYDLASAKSAIRDELLSNDPLFSLAGKDISTVQKQTRKPIQKEITEVTDDIGNVGTMEYIFIEYNDARIVFNSDVPSVVYF